MKRLLEESPADPRRHLDQIACTAEVLEQLPPVVVFELEARTLLVTEGCHRVAATQHAGRTTVQADVRVGTKAQAVQFAIDVARAERACRLIKQEGLFVAAAVVRATTLVNDS